MSKNKHRYSLLTRLWIGFVAILPATLVLLTYFNLRMCKMPDETMSPTVSYGTYVIGLRQNETPEVGQLVVVNESKEDRIVRRVAEAPEDIIVPEGYVYVVSDNSSAYSKTNTTTAGLVAVEDIWGKVWFTIG